MTAQRYLVRRDRSTKLWVPYGGWRWPPPRLLQLMAIARCMVDGHLWSDWAIDDADGPGEWLGPDAFMPYCSRSSRPGEFGTRACRRCSALETRWPAAQAGPLFRGRARAGEH